MKIGMICPYSFDVPGGVQAHVVDLAEVLIERGHKVSVLAPSSDDDELPDFVVSAGKAVAIPYNGSVARLSFGPTANNRLRKFIAEGDFDVLHIHEPNAPSLSMLALRIAEGPIVATFPHVDHEVVGAEHFSGCLGSVSREDQWPDRSLGVGASLAGRVPRIRRGRNSQRRRCRSVCRGRSVARLPARRWNHFCSSVATDEPRKGMAVLLGALPELVERHPDLEVIVVGRGDEEKLRKEAGKYFKHLRLLGQVSDEEKASALRSADVYCAPNLGGESFGIVLVEAMAAGTAVVASELDAFRRVLRDGQAGLLVPIGNSDALAEAIDSVLG